ncbi:hypothetical protein [Burkholderia sp. Ac-20353]|uniref:hypothetical protein n=1 Tax=Burkholderia sp. Ac-20353 TaxID=2703894 RepID=UPI00197B8337|nr:hypothetical protein [Burkholderia sp. Ac-20353]MBN3785662.1 hypothetical protein [Burkholderia sp. Ac-20353]
MSDVLDLPVEPASAPFDPVGKTVAAVAELIELALRMAGIELEWVAIANGLRHKNEATYGMDPCAEWPTVRPRRQRMCLSVELAMSEGWIMQVDYVHFVEEGEGGHWRSVPVMRIMTLSRSQAWAVAAVVSRLLDID